MKWRVLILSLCLLLLGAGRVLAVPMLYWTENSANVIRRANLNGTGIETLLTIADGISGPRALAIDHVDGWMYWSEGEVIKRATLEGTNIQTIVNSDLESCWGIDVDEDNRKLYFTDSSEDRIGRCNLNGSDMEMLVAAQRNPIGIDTDSANEMMYWAISNGYDGIRRIDLDATGAVEDIVPNQDWPLDLAVEAGTGNIYFTDQDLHTIKSANLDGSNVTTVFSGQGRAFGIDIYDGVLYWADYGGGSIHSGLTDGTELQTLIDGLSNPVGLAVYVPEPGTIALLGLGGIGILYKRRASRRH